MESFINKNNLLSDSQYGFRRGRSTSMALINLIEEITTSLDNKKSTIGVFIDLKKAFDTIDHTLLLKKLKHYGIRGITLDWIASYLSDRMQYVQIMNMKSNYSKVVCGVPQGSILGPKLFILYINDICKVSNLLNFVLFADDTNIFFSHKDIDFLINTINKELQNLSTWFAVNKLSLNVSKTHFILFTNKNITSTLNVNINNVNIDRVFHTKFLGVLIDHKLNWKEHIDYICKKLSKSIAVIRKARVMLKYDALYTLYCSIFLPYLYYCVEVWGNTYKSNTNKVFLKQKKVIRIIHNAGYIDHTSPLFFQSKTLKFPDIVSFFTGTFMYKAFHHSLPPNLQNYFTRNSNERRTRQSEFNFYQKYVSTRKKQLSISISGVLLWNSLNTVIKKTKSLRLFKKEYKQKLLSTYV